MRMKYVIVDVGRPGVLEMALLFPEGVPHRQAVSPDARVVSAGSFEVDGREPDGRWKLTHYVLSTGIPLPERVEADREAIWQSLEWMGLMGEVGSQRVSESVRGENGTEGTEGTDGKIQWANSMGWPATK